MFTTIFGSARFGAFIDYSQKPSSRMGDEILTYRITEEQFQKAVDFLNTAGRGRFYSYTFNNCAAMARGALQAADCEVPRSPVMFPDDFRRFGERIEQEKAAGSDLEVDKTLPETRLLSARLQKGEFK